MKSWLAGGCHRDSDPCGTCNMQWASLQAGFGSKQGCCFWSRYCTAKTHSVPLWWLVCQFGDKSDSSLGNSPGLSTINRSQWEEQRPLVGWGVGQEASLGSPEFMAPSGSFSNACFRHRTQSNSLGEGDKSPGEKKGSSFLFSFISFYIRRGREGTMATSVSSGGMLSSGCPILTTLLRLNSPQQTPLQGRPCV